MSNADRLVQWFEMAMNESNEFYIDDIRNEGASCSYDCGSRLEEEMADADCKTEEDFLNYLNGQYDDPIEWYVDNFGADEFGKACLVALGYKSWNDFR